MEIFPNFGDTNVNDHLQGTKDLLITHLRAGKATKAGGEYYRRRKQSNIQKIASTSGSHRNLAYIVSKLIPLPPSDAVRKHTQIF